MKQLHDDSLGLFSVIWQGKWWIVSITLMFAAFSVFYAQSLPEKYSAKVLLAPSDSNANTSMASQFGGLASLAGIAIPNAGANKSGEALALLKTRSFIQGFIHRRNLLPILIAGVEWNKIESKWVFDANIYDQETGVWTRTPPPGKQVVPTPWEGFGKFSQSVTVGALTKDGTLTIEMETESPEDSVRWLRWLIEDLNAQISESEMEEAKKSLSYLKKQVENTQVRELQSIFYRLIEEQTKKILLGEVREDYVFKVLAEPILPEDRSSPNRALICIAITFLGGIVSIFVLLIKAIFNR